MSRAPLDLLQGTLDVLILRTLAWAPMHGYGISRWIRERTHHLAGWETDWSSQTGACQAGLLHGNNHDMPAFRWWEKDRGAAIVTNHPRDAEELERRRSNGRGLLHADGASRANILSGDAVHSMLTMSTVMNRRRPIGRDYSAYFADPYAVARTFLLALTEVVRERWAAIQQRRRDVQPRIHRSIEYAFVRAWATVVQLDLQVAAVVGDILAGRPVVYTTFLAYDEVAHHSGIERPDTLAVLRHVDRQLARVEAAVGDAPRPYRLVVLADHGQSQGATFLQRYGTSFEDLVRSACEVVVEAVLIAHAEGRRTVCVSSAAISRCRICPASALRASPTCTPKCERSPSRNEVGFCAPDLASEADGQHRRAARSDRARAPRSRSSSPTSRAPSARSGS